MGPKSMVYSLPGLGANGARIPVRQETFLMRIVTTPACDAPMLIQWDRLRGPVGGLDIFKELLERQTHPRRHLICGHVPPHLN